MRHLTRRAFAITMLSASVALLARRADAAYRATLYKDPQCGCCEGYAAYLRQNGVEVTVIGSHDLPLLNEAQGVPPELQGCHVTMIDGYFIGGHVPFPVVQRLLAERPAIKGITLPGMPEGSPGMVGKKTAPFVIYEIADGPRRVYATE